MLRIHVGHAYFLRFDPKQWERGKPYPPLATIQVAALLRQMGHTVSLFDAMIWGMVAAVVQVLAFVIARVASGKLSNQIDQNVMSAGIFSAAIAISLGLINAAAITP